MFQFGSLLIPVGDVLDEVLSEEYVEIAAHRGLVTIERTSEPPNRPDPSTADPVKEFLTFVREYRFRRLTLDHQHVLETGLCGGPRESCPIVYVRSGLSFDRRRYVVLSSQRQCVSRSLPHEPKDMHDMKSGSSVVRSLE